MSSTTFHSSSPIGMSFKEKKALLDDNAKMTITWTNKDTMQPIVLKDMPKAMLMAFCPAVKHYVQISTRGNINKYDFGIIANLAPAAVHYLIGAMVAACKTPGVGAMPPAFPDDKNVDHRVKCLAAAKKLDVARFVQHAWRNAAMDAISAAGRVTFQEFAYIHVAFAGEESKSEEPALLRHAINSAVYAELTDAVEHPETLAINKYVYGSQPALALMKKGVETQMEKKLTNRKEMELKRAAKEKAKRAYLEREQRKEAAKLRQQAYWAEKEEKLRKARNGERALTDFEVRAMGTYSCPTIATISSKLR
ncbi:hypothetical protein SLS58_008437 [Diplodia intermedia]|uniref:Uncharacterized protein n=1 Tax=Diplodia intermedia TaxID=856260 RepID=A0ABR3THW6_9PEZI